MLSGKFPRIRQKILQRHPKEPAISARRQSFCNYKLHLPFRLGFLQLRGDASYRAAEIDGLSFHLASGYPREIEHVINELRHPLASIADPVQIVFSLLVQILPIVLQDGLTKTINRSKRRAEVVRYRITECLKLLVNGLEFNCVTLQIVIQDLDALVCPLNSADCA